jgi:hypothetical protein
MDIPSPGMVGNPGATWTRPRQIIAKAGYTHLGANPRFVVTYLSCNPQPGIICRNCL